MGHKIESTDGVMLGSSTPAWHGLGTVVEGQPDSAAAIRHAGLDWETGLEPIFAKCGSNLVAVPNMYATTRSDLDVNDTRRILGVVSHRYTPVHNREAFAICDDLAGEGGARFETAGSIRGGKIVWMLAVMPQRTHVVDDEVARYLLLTAAHDGSRAIHFLFTPTRVVCSNTLHWALRDATQRHSVSHFGGREAIAKRIEVVRRVLGLAGDYFDVHAALSRKLASANIDQRFADSFVTALWPDIDPIDGSKHTRHAKIREKVLGLYNGGQRGGDQAAVRGTAYGLINAVAEFVDHQSSVVTNRLRSKAEARFDSSMIGRGAELKNRAAALLVKSLGFDGIDTPATDEVEAMAGRMLAGSVN